MNRVELQKLSRVRLNEAKALLSAGLYSGSYYLAGYSIECALKACIAKKTQRFEFPDKDRVLKSYSHKPADLIRVVELNTELQRMISSDTDFEINWLVVSNWSEQSRYSVWSHADADAMMTAVTKPRSGVLQWVKRFW